MIELKQILCPVDFSECSRRALDHALAVARCYSSTVTALHVVSPMPVVVPSPYYFGAETPPPMMLPPVDRAAVAAQVQQLAQAEHVPGVRVETLVDEARHVYLGDSGAGRAARVRPCRDGYPRPIGVSAALPRIDCREGTSPSPMPGDDRAAEDARRHAARTRGVHTPPLRGGFLGELGAGAQLCDVSRSGRQRRAHPRPHRRNDASCITTFRHPRSWMSQRGPRRRERRLRGMVADAVRASVSVTESRRDGETVPRDSHARRRARQRSDRDGRAGPQRR